MKKIKILLSCLLLLSSLLVTAQPCTQAPLTLPWVKKLISEKKNKSEQAEIWTGKASEKDIVFVDNCTTCKTGAWNVYSCEGTLVKSIQKEMPDTAYVQTLAINNLIWTNACVSKSLALKSKEAICTREFAPVCGCNNVTYSNACEARASGVINYTKGKCKTEAAKTPQPETKEVSCTTCAPSLKNAMRQPQFSKEIFYISAMHTRFLIGARGYDDIDFDWKSMPADATFSIQLQDSKGNSNPNHEIGFVDSGAKVRSYGIDNGVLHVTIEWWYGGLFNPSSNYIFRIYVESSISDLSDITPFVISNYPSALLLQDETDIQWVVQDGAGFRVIKRSEGQTLVGMPNVSFRY